MPSERSGAAKGRIAAMPTAKERAIEGARILSTKLEGVAAALQRGDHPERDAARMAWILEMTKADQGLAHPREDAEDNRARGHFFAICQRMGRTLSDAKKHPPVRADQVELLADMGIGEFSIDLPMYEARLRKNQRLVRQLIDAYAGGRAITPLREQLCQALGWNASGDAIRQARRRALVRSPKEAAKKKATAR
jgi:hypothetical protein